MYAVILTRQKRPKSVISGKALSLYPLMWLGTTILLAIGLKVFFGGTT